jgi:acyl-CoA reductase-like NAD-dependent aldehyde dehydrogenase
MEARKFQQLVGGEWHPATTGATYERRSPADGELVAVIPWGDERDARAAIDAARRSFETGVWWKKPALERARIMRAGATKIRDASTALAHLHCRESGKPIWLATLEVSQAADVLEYFAGLTLEVRGESLNNVVPDALGITLKEPVGVAGLIIPWNFPLLLLCWKLGPALAAGCSVVAKPSELTAASTFELARLLVEAGIPSGVLGVVTGPGDVVGAELASSARVDKIAFTGSTAVGKTIMRLAANNLKKVSLELGGKSPNVVFADADLAAAVRGAYFGTFLHCGQVCMAATRLLVQASIKERFVAALTDAARAMKVGDPLVEQNFMGPVVSEAQLAKVENYLAIGREEGKLLCGGQRLRGPQHDAGLYVAPTVFDDVPPEARIAREEIFGPVVSVMTFRDREEAIALANDTCYGLAAAVWTKDIDNALHVARGIRAGTVWVNAYISTGLGNLMPFGGYKESGFGRELGRMGLDEYLETKSLHLKLS